MQKFSQFYNFVKKNSDLYSREEAKNLKENFWTKFGQYMSVIPSAEGDKINWVNYKTGIKHLYFRMKTSNKSAEIYIEISHPDLGIRHLMFTQLEELKLVFQEKIQEEWDWDEFYTDDDGKGMSKISISISKLSVFNKDNWPDLISFFKPRLIALDEFWSIAKYSFEIFK